MSRACAGCGGKTSQMATGGTACEASAPPLSEIALQWVRGWTEEEAERLLPILRFRLSVSVETQRPPHPIELTLLYTGLLS